LSIGRSKRRARILDPDGAEPPTDTLSVAKAVLAAYPAPE
jgi:hypothetical protein